MHTSDPPTADDATQRVAQGLLQEGPPTERMPAVAGAPTAELEIVRRPALAGRPVTGRPATSPSTPRALDHRPAVGAHRLLGQGRGAALIRPDAMIDWWCPGHFDATPLLWSLLDADGGAAFWLDAEIATWDDTPAGPTARSTLRFTPRGHRVLTWDGLVTIDGASSLVRLVRAEVGTVTVTHRFRAGGFDAPRESFSGTRPVSAQLQITGDGIHHVDGWHVDTTIVARADGWTGFAIVHGARAPVELGPADLVALLRRAELDEQRAERRMILPDRHPMRVADAFRVLRALTDADSGAPVASPTTSLPEAVGGTRQFDYRYTWLRDSANAVAVAALLGHNRASARYLDFLADLVQRPGQDLHPLSRADGTPIPPEREVSGIAGWAGSVPVRVGNAAAGQRQIDAVTAVLDSLVEFVRCGGRMTRRRWALVEDLAGRLVDAPVGASNGVWELRDPLPLVSEEVARWAGLDRALWLRRHRRPWRRRRQWVAARSAARARIEAAYDDATGTLPQSFGEPHHVPDASALLAAVNGLLPRRDPRLRPLVRTTVAALEEGPFLRRYPAFDDGFIGREGCFVPATWWAVSALAIVGDLEEAQSRATALCAQLPRLQPEAWDVVGHDALGNTPLLWSHTECARALYHLQRERIRARVGTPGLAVWSLARRVRTSWRRLLT